MPVRSIRGAVTCANEADAVYAASKELLTALISRNGIDTGSVISVLFTATNDLTAAYPAPAARDLGITRAGIMCMQEQAVTGSLPFCIRVMLLAETDMPQSAVKHVYLRDAAVLRPDLDSAFFAVAIDGPAGSGKSTAAKILAADLGFIYVDTGAMYRAAALYCINSGIDPGDETAVNKILPDLRIELKHINGEQRVFLNGEDVTKRIRMQDTADASSKAAAHPAVRSAMTAMQRDIAAKNNVVMDGRDIGTVVLPFAQVKVYMDASPRIRARRRVSELAAKGAAGADIDTVEREIKERDERDKNREHAPLKRHKDAVYIDTDGMTANEAAAAIKEIVNKCCTAL